MYPIEHVGYEEWVLVEQDRKHIFTRFRNVFGRNIDVLITDNKVHTYIAEQVSLSIKEEQALKETEGILLQESVDIAKYKYPIEKYGWTYSGIDETLDCVRFKKSVYILTIFRDGSIHIGLSNLTFCNFDFDELKALQETANQIQNKD